MNRKHILALALVLLVYVVALSVMQEKGMHDSPNALPTHTPIVEVAP